MILLTRILGMKNTLTLLMLFSTVLLSGCASFKDALTPNPKIYTDEFENTKYVRQLPVTTASTIADASHFLGFEWSNKMPGLIYIDAGTLGSKDIKAVAFKVNNLIIKPQLASKKTIIDNEQSAGLDAEQIELSTRRFVMKFNDFLVLHKADLVKIKLSANNSFSLSSFGRSTKSPIQIKMDRFLNLINPAKYPLPENLQKRMKAQDEESEESDF